MNKRGKKMDSLSYLTEKLMHLQQKYPQRPRYCALRMMITAAHAIFMKSSYCIRSTPLKALNQPTAAGPTLVFDIKGGLGDFIIAINFIYCLALYLNDKHIKFKIAYHSQELLDSFCQNLPQLVHTGSNVKLLHGDLVIEINRFPRILAGNAEKLYPYNHKLKILLEAWNKFFLHYRKFFDFMPQLDGWSNYLTLINGQKSINRCDINRLLCMGEEYLYPIPMEAGNHILANYHLSPRKYISIHRGKGMTSPHDACSKLWSINKYEDLCQLLTQNYPDYPLVQLGAPHEKELQPINHQLVGKLNIAELKVILKNSALHIDSEGGLVHLRHALHGGISAVIFGATSPDVYGYRENINLTSKACPGACEWLRNDWESTCLRTSEKFICLAKLTPEDVFQAISNNTQWRVDNE